VLGTDDVDAAVFDWQEVVAEPIEVYEFNERRLV